MAEEVIAVEPPRLMRSRAALRQDLSSRKQPNPRPAITRRMKPPCRCRGRGALPLNVARGCGVSGGTWPRRLAVQQSSPAPSKDVEEPLTRYELLPRLTTRFTLEPRTSFFPAFGLCEITRPFRTVFE
jgi:hypothetical protein